MEQIWTIYKYKRDCIRMHLYMDNKNIICNTNKSKLILKNTLYEHRITHMDQLEFLYRNVYVIIKMRYGANGE